MKKRVLMILLIVVSILLIPRSNGSTIKNNAKQGVHLNKKAFEEPDELDVPFLGLWSVENIISKPVTGSMDVNTSLSIHWCTVNNTNFFHGLWVYPDSCELGTLASKLKAINHNGYTGF